jgi:predicted metal-dependent hydrolase
MGHYYVADLRPHLTDAWQLTLMVSRSWTSYNPKTNRVFSFDLIMTDERVRQRIFIYM